MTTPRSDRAADLDELLGRWANVHRLTAARASAVRAAILEASAEPRVELDADWLWGLLRPVTSLLDGPNRFNETLSGLISVGA